MKKIVLLSALVLTLASCSTTATPAEEKLAKDTATCTVDTCAKATTSAVVASTVAAKADTTKK